jgi:hypothetical protein
MTKQENPGTNLTLERQRVVTALINAVQLRLTEGMVDVDNRALDGQTYVRADRITEDVVAGLGVSEDIVRLALESAVQQGLLLVPAVLPVSEHPITLVRPGTL